MEGESEVRQGLKFGMSRSRFLPSVRMLVMVIVDWTRRQGTSFIRRSGYEGTTSAGVSWSVSTSWGRICNTAPERQNSGENRTYGRGFHAATSAFVKMATQQRIPLKVGPRQTSGTMGQDRCSATWLPPLPATPTSSWQQSSTQDEDKAGLPGRRFEW